MELLTLGIVIYLFILYRRIKIKKLLSKLKSEINKFNQEIEEIRKSYITYLQTDELKVKYKNLYNSLSIKLQNKEDMLKEFVRIYDSLDNFVREWNGEFVEKELEENKGIFDNIDGKSLDNQQRRAVIVDEINNLVLAGAGSGKTFTISAKVKYLVTRKNINPDDILLISFTKKAADEMSSRITKGLDISVKAQTFHKVGLDIITKSRRKRPDIAEENSLSKVAYDYLRKNIFQDEKQMNSLVVFFGCYLYIPKDLGEFKSLGEEIDFYRGLDLETIKSKVNKDEIIKEGLKRQKGVKQTIQGETVKSLEELMIANFLYLNGINYIYEYKYPHELEDIYRKHYKPDFYLTEYDIYLEHFGITKDLRVPWLSEIEEEIYLDGIDWKRKVHAKNGTKLLETYSYYNERGLLLEELEKMLKQEKVKFKKIDRDKIYRRILENRKQNHFREALKLFETFIQLFKSNGYSVRQFGEFKKEVDKNKNVFLKERARLFLDIVKQIYVEYENYLKQKGLIDFNDMINMAREIIEKDNLMFNYKYIIIDEYQDISVSRYKLIKAIRDRSNSKVICVGDDWQSIYRFAGSDIDLFTNFKEYFGYYELLKIENTYRNSQELVDIAGKFIMENPNQLGKNLKSTKKHDSPLRIFTYNETPSTALKRAIEEIVNCFGKNSKITILGRNNFDIDNIENDMEDSQKEFRVIEKNSDKMVVYRKYPNLAIDYLTAHRSKGLEADNVIVINLENNPYGFPNKVADDPMLSLVLTRQDDFEFAEERRLFYVALTRTRNTTYLIAPVYIRSIFCEELVKKFNIKCEPSDHEDPITSNPNCPRCQKGYLVVRESGGGRRFLGCSNYPYCDYTLNHPEIVDSQIRCTRCGGYMVKRDGKYGEFYGCTNFPFCRNKQSIWAVLKTTDVNYIKFNKNSYDSKSRKTDNIKSRDNFKRMKTDGSRGHGGANLYKEKNPDGKTKVASNKVTSFNHNDHKGDKTAGSMNKKNVVDRTAMEKLIGESDYFYENKIFNRKALAVNQRIICNGYGEVKYYLRLADCHKNLNEIEEAVEVYKRVITIDRKNRIAQDNLTIYGKGLYQKFWDKPFNGVYRDIGSPPAEEVEEWYIEEIEKINRYE